MIRQDELFIINEYKDEIIRAVVICVDFKISFENFFKEKYLIDYVYRIYEEENYKLYTYDYSLQKVYNEIYIKYRNLEFAFKKNIYNIMKNIKEIYNQLGILFDYDIIKVIKQRTAINYEEKKKNNSTKKNS